VRKVVATTVIACLVGAMCAGLAFARGHSLPPAGAEFDGRFNGPGGNTSFIAIEHGGDGWIRALDGDIPATCVNGGKTQVAGRDGAVGIHFSLWSPHKLLGTNRAGTDGRFAFGIKHLVPRGEKYEPGYTVWIKARFDGTTIRGSVHGTLSGFFEGKCRGDRSFVARRA
jgi:hypothetical protein